MDDLLALIDDCQPQQTKTQDNVLSNDNNNIARKKHPSSSSTSTNIVTTATTTTNNNNSSSSNGNNKNNNAHATIDPFTKIRIVNRQISKLDLVDIFSPFDFHTTATLSSMSNQTFSSILISSSTSTSTSSSPSGRTNAATMGIIFKNSKTQISKKTSRAFCILTIGDLHTGPTISILLFGSAYSKFVTIIQSGYVVAFVGMNLLPMRENVGGETRVSFSVNDVEQVYVVGKALDYGICAGHTKGGTGSAGGLQGSYYGDNKEMKRCRNYVDLRISKYCQYHLRQQHHQPQHQQRYNNTSNGRPLQTITNRNSSNNNNKTKSKLSFVQSMKAERAETQLLRQQTNTRGGMSLVTSLNSSQSVNNKTMTMVMPKIGGNHLQSQSVVTHISKTNTNNNDDRSNRLLLSNVPKHLTKGSHSASMTTTSTSNKATKSSKNAVHNPYVKTQTRNNNNDNDNSNSNTNTKQSSKKQSINHTASTDILAQALTTPKMNQHQKQKQMQQQSKTKKRKFVQSHVQGFDGQVSIPKPNPLFNKITQDTTHHVLSSSAKTTSSSHAITPSPNQHQDMLIYKQKKIAEQLKLNKLNKISSRINSNDSTQHSKNNNNTSIKDSFSHFFNTDNNNNNDDNLDLKQIYHAKSKYEKEANAELFAKNRNMLTELEKRELSHDKRQLKKKINNNNSDNGVNGNGVVGGNSSSSNPNNNNNIVLKWTCTTCKRTTSIRPNVCIRQNHIVKRKREIKMKESVVEQRLGVRMKDVGDGGLVIGSGLEWSGWKK